MSAWRQSPLSPDIPRDSRDRLVIFHQGALGDLLLSLPLFDGLARLTTNQRIDFWGRPELLSLLATKAYFGRIGSCDSGELADFFHDELWRQAQVPLFFQEAASLFIFGQDQSRTLAERMRHRLAAPVIWVRSFPRGGRPVAVGAYLVDQVRAAGWPIDHSLPQLVPQDDEVQSVRIWYCQEGWEHGRSPVLIHPGSGSLAKIWPLQRWWCLIQWLLNQAGVPVLLLVGPADQITWPLAESAKTMGAHLITDVPLPRLAAIISQCRLFVGNDSGVTHLAAALGVPTVAIFGPTCPEVWAPRGPRVEVIESLWKPSEALSFPSKIPPQAVEPSVLTAVVRVLSGWPQV
jgi:heptosyltransferase III